LSGAFSPTTVSASGNITGGNIVTGGRVTATGNIVGSVFIGNGSGLTSITGANVTGTVPLATSAGTVTTAAQPNITSVGTLSSVTVTANVDGGNITTGGVVSATGNLVTVANVLVAGDYVQLPVASSNPSNPVTGALYYNTNIGGLRLWTGTVWDDV
jgi:hypothetical protein